MSKAEAFHWGGIVPHQRVMLELNNKLGEAVVGLEERAPAAAARGSGMNIRVEAG